MYRENTKPIVYVIKNPSSSLDKPDKETKPIMPPNTMPINPL